VTTGVNHITLAVSDLPRAIAFYVGVVGCTKAATWTRGAYLCLLQESPYEGLDFPAEQMR
jgi:catechol 2,3-dioxygenase-like lactoylglutathione lyase family enzyme